MKRNWTKKEIVLWGLGEAGGTTEFIDTETVGVLLFHKHPGIFALRKYPQYPDIDVARIQLSDAKRDKGPADPARVVQDTDLKRPSAGRGKQRILSKNPTWKLNAAGIKWYEENKAAISQSIDSASKVGERRSSVSTKISADKITSAVLNRIRLRPSFSTFQKNNESVGPEELSILDFFEVFNVDAHTPEVLYQQGRQRLKAALEEGSPEARYCDALATMYGSCYRTYYDKLLAGEVST